MPTNSNMTRTLSGSIVKWHYFLYHIASMLHRLSMYCLNPWVPTTCLIVTQTYHVATHGQLYLPTPPVTFHVWVQPVAPQSLVKPSGRLEREVAPDLGLAGAAQLGIKLGSQSKPAAAPTPAQAPSASKPSSSHRSQGHPSTSGRQVLYTELPFVMAGSNTTTRG